MNWKPSIFVSTLALSLAGGCFGWQPPAVQMEVVATGRGNFVAWPAGMLERGDAEQIAAQAENDLATTGRIASSTSQDLVIKTKSSPPRKKAPDRSVEGGAQPRLSANGRSAPSGEGGRPVIQPMQLQISGQACRGVASTCTNAEGAPCQPGQPGCRCGCMNPLPPGAAAMEAARSKRDGVIVFVIAPSEDAIEEFARMSLERLRRPYFLKVSPL
ncbi:MAG: hypothetical protein NZR01_11780 [Bryobacteraceae bacterium]|nr:hypothetical protein [Bryobacteraceae bacterium]